MAKFDNAKVGDRVWDVIKQEWGIITKIERREGNNYPISVEFNTYKGYFYTYTDDGYLDTDHKIPFLYWNEIHLPTDEEDKKPFDLVEFLKENLKPKEFELGMCKCYIYYNVAGDEFSWWWNNNGKIIGLTYFAETKMSDVVSTLNAENVTYEQLKEAFKELGW